MARQEAFIVNLTGTRLKTLKMQNLSQMSITNFEHQKVSGCSDVVLSLSYTADRNTFLDLLSGDGVWCCNKDVIGRHLFHLYCSWC